MLRNLTLAGIFALALPSFALADGDGAVKGAVGSGCWRGRGRSSRRGCGRRSRDGCRRSRAGPQPVVVAPQPVIVAPPCNTQTTTTTDNNTGASATTQSTNCPN
jgi:hypothetical protein